MGSKYKTTFPLIKLVQWIGSFFLGKEQSFYEKEPEAYERIIHSVVKRYDLAKEISKIINDTFPQKKFDFILDTACGTGIITEELAKKISLSGKTYGVDLSQTAIEYAKKKRLSDIVFLQGDFHEMPFVRNESIDLYHMFGGYRFVNPRLFWNEVHRVLTLGGIALVTHSWPDMNKRQLQEAIQICHNLGLKTEIRKIHAKGLINKLTTRELLIVIKN